MASEKVTTLTDTNFDQSVIKASQPVLVDFWAEWCGPCKRLGPTIDELAAHYDTMVSPHNYMSPLSTLVNAHLYAAMPNFEIFEIDIDDIPWKWDLIDQKIEIIDGELIVPNRPGLGANIVESVVAEHPLKTA